MRSILRQAANSLLAPFEVELVRRGQGAFRNYIPFRTTVAAAKAAGMKVGDYIDATYNVAGATQQTVTEMARLGVFNAPIERVCEVGPGSGRYLDKTLSMCQPQAYEVYETARDWRQWLSTQYPIVAHQADGTSLSCTASSSIDLVHAHKVLPGLPIFTVCRYFDEMARVAGPKGRVVFDVLTEECLRPEHLRNWFGGHTWPQSMIPKDFAIAFFAERGLSHVGSFIISMSPGITEYLVFVKTGSPNVAGAV